MTAKPYSANVKIEDIPRETWEAIERIATRMQQPKKAIVKMALIEFALHHDAPDSEIPRAAPDTWPIEVKKDG